MMRKFILLALVLLSLTACKKDKLEGNQQLLEGKWKWDCSLQYNYAWGNLISIDTLLAKDYINSYIIEFDRKGKVRYLIDNQIHEDFRIVFQQFDVNPEPYQNCNLVNCMFFHIFLNNDPSNGLVGTFNKDTMNCFGQQLPISNWGVLSDNYSQEHFYLKAD